MQADYTKGMNLTTQDLNAIRTIVREEIDARVPIIVDKRINAIVPEMIREEINTALSEVVVPLFDALNERIDGIVTRLDAHQDYIEGHGKRLGLVEARLRNLPYGV